MPLSYTGPTPRSVETRRGRMNMDTDTPASAGGNTLTYKQEVAGLKIGDVVVVSSNIDNSVVKSTVAADALKFAGVGIPTDCVMP